MRKAMFFGNQILPEPNTFIGGVGATTVTSAEDLASISSLAESDIEGFEIVNTVNLRCNAKIAFSFNANNSFQNNADITYMIDASGLQSIVRDYNNATNLTHLYLPNATSGGDQFDTDNLTNLEKINVESISTLTQRLFVSDSDKLEKLDLRSLTNINVNSISGVLNQLSKLRRLFIGNVTSMNQTNLNSILIRNTARQPTFWLNGSVSGNLTVYHSASWGVADRQAFTRIRSGWSVGDTCTINGLVYTAVNGAPTTDGEFDASIGGSVSHTNFNNAINSDTRTGSADFESINDNSISCVRAIAIGAGGNSITAVMGGANTGSASVDWSPFRYGNDVHHALVDMRDIEGATLVEVSPPISVNSPTNLSVSNQTATSVDLNFTLPISNANGNDGYEVWLDDSSDFRKWFEFSEISSSGDTLDLTDVFNDAGTISGTKIKIRTIDGHFNFSPFSNELTLP